MKNCKIMKARLSMALIDYRKKIDLLHHSRTFKFLDMCGAAGSMLTFLSEMWNFGTSSWHQAIRNRKDKVKIKQVIFDNCLL